MILQYITDHVTHWTVMEIEIYLDKKKIYMETHSAVDLVELKEAYDNLYTSLKHEEHGRRITSAQKEEFLVYLQEGL